jgi:hypothetical protein
MPNSRSRTTARCSSQFEEELEAVEVDDIDPSIRWNRCGGHLHVMVAPLVA